VKLITTFPNKASGRGRERRKGKKRERKKIQSAQREGMKKGEILNFKKEVRDPEVT
jgi:hypothetical protein